MGLEDEVSSLGKGWQINCNSYAVISHGLGRKQDTIYSDWAICGKLYLQRCGQDLGELKRDSIQLQGWQYWRPITTPKSGENRFWNWRGCWQESCLSVKGRSQPVATPAKNKYPNITLLQLSALLWLPPSKANQKTQGKRALDVVLRVGDCTKNRVENKQGANPNWSRVVAWNQLEQASVTSFNLIRTDHCERHAPNLRMGWGTVSACACASYVCNEHQMGRWRRVCHMFPTVHSEDFHTSAFILLNGTWLFQQMK